MINPITPIYRRVEMQSPSYRVEKIKRKELFGDILKEKEKESESFERRENDNKQEHNSQQSDRPPYEEIMAEYLRTSQYRPPIIPIEEEEVL